jgi:hypothetical protein
MKLGLHRVRFQETWGEQFGEYLHEAITGEEISGLLQRYASEWFPDSSTLTQDPDSAMTWVLTENAGEKRRVLFFIEPIR